MRVPLTFLLVCIAACHSAPPPPEVPPPPPPPPPVSHPGPAEADHGGTVGESKDYAVVKVFFGTDRNLQEGAVPEQRFGGDRSTESYGVCSVSIPRDHRMGELEAPAIWKLEFRPDPSKHVVLLSVDVLRQSDFLTSVSQRVNAGSTKSAFVFVHGYNVTFADAARRTAQMAYDLAFDGAPVFYSWPSKGGTADYTVDEQSIEWSQSHLRVFLEDFVSHSEAQNIYLIAHSMGNRALTGAFMSLVKERPDLGKRIKELILTAPDIDADVFKQDIAPILGASGVPTTLYASSVDWALQASRKVHGAPRAGDSGRGLVIVRGIETIDATQVDTSLLGHSYFAESKSVLGDLYVVLKNHVSADHRFGLRAIDVAQGRYWVFKQ